MALVSFVQPKSCPSSDCSSSKSRLGLFEESLIGGVGIGVVGSVYSTVSKGCPCSRRTFACSITYARRVGLRQRFEVTVRVFALRAIVTANERRRMIHRVLRLYVPESLSIA